MQRNAIILILGGLTIGILIVGSLISGNGLLREDSPVDPENIEDLMQQQVDIGPRYPGSQGSLDFKDWVISQISNDWEIEIQNFTHQGIELRNYFITSQTNSEWPNYLIGAHYDSRKVADNDLNNPEAPVPGANDGASGVAAILEMMDHIPTGERDSIGFILFDGEDQGSGGMEGWNWIVGSEYFVNQMSSDQIDATEFFLLYDMIANDELTLKWEGYSDDTLNTQIWEKAEELGYESIFVQTNTGFITDDHRPFFEAGIEVVDLIDLSYPEWHTVEDDMDHVSAENAAIVVDVVLEWMDQYHWGENNSTSTVGKTNDNSDSTRDRANFYFIGSMIIMMIFVKKSHILRIKYQA